jgi:antitoxin ParD1/3/4
MAQVEKVSVALTQEMAAMVREAVACGEYASSSEIVREALRDWKAKRALQQVKLEDMRRLVREGHASGSVPWPGKNALLAEARRRSGRAKIG